MQKNNSIFLKVIGDSPRNRVLDFLIIFKNYDYSMSDIAKNSKVGWSTLNLFWKDLEKYKIVVMTRKVGRAKMYKLNEENPIVKNLIQIHWLIIKSYKHKELMKKPSMITVKA